jgi:predicted HicB family RNase H-like nuclease
MSLNNDRYTYRITWSEGDKEYVGLCLEFPSLSWLAKSQEAALRGIRKVVADAVKDMRDNGEEIPVPLAGRSFSGRFLVRVPPRVHRELAMKAAEEGVSLNRLVSAKLSSRA